MKELVKLINLISGGNVIPTKKGSLIPETSIDFALLEKHKSEINQLCASNNLKISKLPKKVTQMPNFSEDGTFMGMMDVEDKDSGGLFIMKNRNSDEDIIASLS